MTERSFLALYGRTAAPLRAYVVRALGNATAADDIVQEAFLRILRMPPATDDPERLRAFLFRVAGNLMTDYWRQHGRERPTRESSHAEARHDLSERRRAGDAASAACGPDIPLRVDMARTFEQLRPQQRQMMWLAYVEGANHREIAEALGVRERSVRVLLHRARRRLAKLLRGSGAPRA